MQRVRSKGAGRDVAEGSLAASGHRRATGRSLQTTRRTRKAIGQDAKALEQLLANLRAAAAKAEAERRAAAKRAAAEAAAQARRGKTDRPDRPGKTPQGRRQCTGPKVGGLSWPVSGNLLARFNATCPMATPVKAC